jgi:hypothetical protein
MLTFLMSPEQLLRSLFPYFAVAALVTPLLVIALYVRDVDRRVKYLQQLLLGRVVPPRSEGTVTPIRRREGE